ncbi:hypothetical protein SLEP1_g26718 [Rubroshorea leprosula]|uniref:Uncharacterized protein n=1 Tax=Rubroshorea leprosula TaxID=152421 RepID=A0AAV5JUB4_9ROSI|nr:hypothetical protein SLEP1_g26718 [Rubroshorea leprosula]
MKSSNSLSDRVGCFEIVINAPSLVYLENSVSDMDVAALTIVNVQSLVEANIDFKQWSINASHYVSVATDLMRGMSNIQTLCICGPFLMSLLGLGVTVPDLPNLIHLAIYCTTGFSLEELPYLLQCCESIETLVLKGCCTWDYVGWTLLEGNCLSFCLKTIKFLDLEPGMMK